MNVQSSGNISHTLAVFAAGLEGSQIPAEVRLRAQHHMLDAIGIAFASGRFDFARKMLAGTVALGGQGAVPVIGMATTLSPRDAAMMNGFLVHGLDFDDTHMGGIIHPTASIMPAVFSAAVMKGAKGADIITAYVVGMEAATRLAAVGRGAFHQVGFHPTGIIGIFGCVLAVGKLFGLTPAELAHAQGVAVSMAAGSMEFLEDGAWNKRLHPGWAAQAAITAVSLAQSGFVGITRPYEGRFGLFNAYMGKEVARADYSLATQGLGQTWELLNTAIKPYPTCHFVHACIDSALILRQQGLTADDIEKIEALVPADAIKTVCEPEANKKRPANSYDAQFSVPFLTAAAFVRGCVTLAELEEDALKDARILDLATRCSYRSDPDSPFPKAYSGELRVTTKSGKELRHREHINRGAADRPLSNAEIAEKFRGNAALAMSAGTISEVEGGVLALEQANDPSALVRILGASVH